MVPSNNHVQRYVDAEGNIQVNQDGVATNVVGAVDTEVLPFPMEPAAPHQTFAPFKHLSILLESGTADFACAEVQSGI